MMISPAVLCVLCALALAWPAKAATAEGGSCSSDIDCQLAGSCSNAGSCACDPGWRGALCESLDLAPAPFGRERQAFETERASWGGKAVRDVDTGVWSLFAAEMQQGGLHAFKGASGSQLIRAEAPSAAGPFVRKEVLHAPLAHNPQPYAFANGSVCVFMIATPFDGNSTRNTTGNFPYKLTIGCAPRPAGPFEWVQPLLLDANGSAVDKDNPSAVFDERDGSVTLVTRGISLFRASHWRGPYHMQAEDVLPTADTSEDPFLFRTVRGWHMLLHDHKPFAFHKQVTVHAFTKDPAGIAGWRFNDRAPAASGTNVSFDDGSVHTFCSRQRPQLLFENPPDPDGTQRGRPALFFTGVQRGPLSERVCGNTTVKNEFNPFFDYSFTFAQPFVFTHRAGTLV